MIAKRAFDILLATIACLILTPVFLAIGAWILWDSGRPIFFQQVRVGKDGVPFTMHKYRTMCVGTLGIQVTPVGDTRITKSGRILRRTKLDELPQLINVIKGEMSLVGPRPEVPRYLQYYPLDVRRKVLSVLPGMTDFAAIEFRDEGALLAASDDPERAYIERVLPVKLDAYLRYVRERSFLLDLQLIIRTIAAVIGR